MICPSCGYDAPDGVSFCTNCGTALAGAAATDAGAGAADAAPKPQELGASLKAALEVNQDTIDSIEARAQAQVDAAFSDFPPTDAPDAYDAGASSDAAAAVPDAPAGYDASQAQPASQANPVVVPVGVPGYQAAASPNAHYSSQRTYDANPYGQATDAAGYQPPSYQAADQSGYQQPSYGQPGGGSAPRQAWSDQSATPRCLAMVLYISGLIGMIVGLCVRDKGDAFITHHLNNVVVIFLGYIISSFLVFIGIGLLLYLYLFVMTILGMVSAYNGDTKELPLIGKIHLIK